MPAILRYRRIGNQIKRNATRRVYRSMNNMTVIQYNHKGKSLGKPIADSLDMDNIDSIVSNDNTNPIAT